MRCDWAGCSRTDTTLADGWLHCPPHLAEHRELVNSEPRQPGCGSARGYGAHKRRGQEPCDSCRAAKTEYERGRRTRKVSVA